MIFQIGIVIPDLHNAFRKFEEIVTFEWGEYLKRSKKGAHDTVLLGWTGDKGKLFIHWILKNINLW